MFELKDIHGKVRKKIKRFSWNLLIIFQNTMQFLFRTYYTSFSFDCPVLLVAFAPMLLRTSNHKGSIGS